MVRTLFLGLLALAASVPAPGRGAGTVIAIEGYVPLVCRVNLTTGTLHEFCNSGSGYRVYASASPELAGATLVVDGVRQPLGRGEVVIATSATPGIVNRAVTVEGAPSGGSLSLRIEAI